jgi:hypothetical protein
MKTIQKNMTKENYTPVIYRFLGGIIILTLNMINNVINFLESLSNNYEWPKFDLLHSSHIDTIKINYFINNYECKKLSTPDQFSRNVLFFRSF